MPETGVLFAFGEFMRPPEAGKPLAHRASDVILDGWGDIRRAGICPF